MMNSKFVTLTAILIVTLNISACTPQKLLSYLSSEASKSDMEAAIRKCPNVREKMEKCLNLNTSVVDAMTGRCIHPMTKRSINYMVQDCLEEQNESSTSKQAKTLSEIH